MLMVTFKGGKQGPEARKRDVITHTSNRHSANLWLIVLHSENFDNEILAWESVVLLSFREAL